ncbi:MAG: hypothetical protein HYV09_30840 [Deltaproteobacteria bacterium]|nr:hypothetical protein [Deltaproteobacteria bacterium]
MKLIIPLIAPVPVGHHVTIHGLEERNESFFGGAEWVASEMKIVCDDETRIVYTGRFVATDSLRYDALQQLSSNYRLAPDPLRGHVTACTLLTDHGDGIRMKTLLELEPDAGGYR